MKIVKIIFALFFIVGMYMHIVTPQKKHYKPTKKVYYRHGRLKVVFGGKGQ